MSNLHAPRIQAEHLPYWGKAAATPTPGAATWHRLAHHSLDVAAVGAALPARLPALRQLFSDRLGLPSHLLDNWLGFCLALHDLGKFSEAFQSQRPDLFSNLRGRAPSRARPYTLRHDSLGMLFWTEVVKEQLISDAWFGAHSEDLADGIDCWMRACTGHHGQPPSSGDTWTQHFHVTEDRAAALAFVGWARAHFLVPDLVSAIAALAPPIFLQASKELSWWVAGLAVLADWLGSNTAYFRYEDQATPLADYWPLAQQRAELALHGSGIVAPASEAAMPFVNLFPSITAPSPLQAWATQVSLHAGPQFHLLEDVTGAGKTEAALMLTHRLMASGNADGFFVALPTMATANAMYARVATTYGRLFGASASLALAHGQRKLVDEFAATVVEHLAAAVLPRDGEAHDARQADETASARCTAWLADHNKRALLAPAGVGTIDQVLLAVLHSKHQSLRLLGLLRKVLVVDEVHACDDYMEGVLSVLLEFHARAGGSVVLLSATLPQRMKQRLLAAFARGLQQAPPVVSAMAYPLATVWPAAASAGAAQTALATRPDVRRHVRVRCSEHLDEVFAAIRNALTHGQCVCWVRNTVADAVEAFERFQPVLAPKNLLLFHARFALHDRLAMEQQVLHLFGKHSGPSERAGRLLLATQVVEQSLDVDFDLLVTDLAPIDRVVQRAGRLRRHRRHADGTPVQVDAAPDERGEPVLWVLTPPWQTAPDARWFKAAFSKAAAVYPHHGQLWLTTRVLREGGFTMPDDARRLIETVFGNDDDLPPGLQANAMAAEGLGYAALTQAQMNTLKLGSGYERGGIDWWSEAKTPSRLGDASSTVALARWEDGRLRPWVDRAPGWAYSSLRVAERLIADTAPATDPALQAAVEAARADMPAQGRWAVLLPLVHGADGWVGEALAAARKDQAPRRLAWRYDTRRGLHMLKPGNPETPTTVHEDPEA